MELGEACAVYLDDRVKDERWVVRNSDSTAGGTYTGLETSAAEDDEIHTNTRLFLGIFRKGNIFPISPVWVFFFPIFHLSRV